MSLQYRVSSSLNTRAGQSASPRPVPASFFRPLPMGPALHSRASALAPLPGHSATASAPSRRGPVSRLQAVSVTADASGGKKVAIITGASSGLGLNAARVLSASGEWHVVMACRDFLKAELAAQRLGFKKGSYSVIHLDLSCLESVRKFVKDFRSTGMPVDTVVCNAAVYLPTVKEPRFTAEGLELSVGTNHLGHFLLANELLEDLKKSKAAHRRMIIVGSITGNTNTLAGNVPPRADLGDLSGLAAGLNGKPAVMIDGGLYDGAKAYKDSKVCNMLTMRQMHKRFHASTGIEFASLYPGCIAETGLFRDHYPLFKTLFPPFQKYITKGFVSEQEAGERLAQVVSDPKMSASGTYWSWNRETGTFSNQVSEEVSDDAKGARLWELSEQIVGMRTPAMV